MIKNKKQSSVPIILQSFFFVHFRGSDYSLVTHNIVYHRKHFDNSTLHDNVIHNVT